MSEPESHSHRTDQEWKAIVRSWYNRFLEHWIMRTQEIADTLGEMERESK